MSKFSCRTTRERALRGSNLPKFNTFAPLDERDSFVALIKEIATWVPIIRRIRACRDPRDDKFLELAINGSADVILTGDDDLLALHPFHRIAILTPAAWLQSDPELQTCPTPSRPHPAKSTTGPRRTPSTSTRC